ncbi:WBSCR22, partial [Symbiodinium necroappetens]
MWCRQRSGSLQINLENTPQGFPVVVGHSEPSASSAEEGQLIVRGPSDKVDVVNMRRALSSF